ncbi:MAG TPA: rod shape-determining protein MreC [Thermoanaerobaculia bacterium]|nr:rod shape-determining protein MreC [Thermoanaerobaculia bacterium]
MDERRTGWVLLFVLAGQLVVLAIQAARSPGESRLETVGLRVLGPVARAIAGMPRSVSEAGEGMKLRGQLLEENRALKKEVEELRLKLLRLTDVEGEMRRLGSAVRYPAPPAGRIRAVDIIYVDHASWLRTLVLYTGSEPARENQPVLSHEGLVGRVVKVAGPYAKAQLITDGAASVGGMILRTRRQGVVRGGGRSGGALELDYVPLQADVRPGDRVVTAGIDGVYPRGIPIGTVVEVTQGGQLFHRIQLAPAVDFGLLDQVYLLDYESVPKDLKEAVPGARP